jgi:signal transduction histidine kinase
VQGLILFTAKESGTREPLDLNECLAQALDTLSSRLRGKVHVVREWAKVPPVEGSRADIVHALTNVLLNAAEAIGKEGMITVRTGGERENAVVEVSDTGCGIPPDALSKIFEPFFTTKESRKGIGLGMAIVHGIIKRHNGTIDVQSAVGKGTTVIITLPAKMGTVPIF